MTTTGVHLRQSAHSNAFDIGATYSRKFAFYEDSPRAAHDLEQYTTSLELIVFDAAGVKIEKFTCTVLTATAEKEADPDGTLVANKCTVTLTIAGAAGDYFFHIIGTKGGLAYQLARPAPVGYYSAPAVT